LIRIFQTIQIHPDFTIPVSALVKGERAFYPGLKVPGKINAGIADVMLT
jgi:hypothetical protein